MVFVVVLPLKMVAIVASFTVCVAGKMSPGSADGERGNDLAATGSAITELDPGMTAGIAGIADVSQPRN